MGKLVNLPGLFTEGSFDDKINYSKEINERRSKITKLDKMMNFVPWGCCNALRAVFM